jgi:SAM-dependent methyltransferase
MTPPAPPASLLHWADPREPEFQMSALWRSANGSPPPKRVQLADDKLSADAAYKLASEGTGLIWAGDFQNAKHLLQALARRIDRKPVKAGATLTETFHLQRQRLGLRTRVLGQVLIPVTADYRVCLKRAPDFQAACTEAWGPPSLVAERSGDTTHSVVSLRELQAVVSAHEWRKVGVDVPALGPKGKIHPHWGVFSPLRGEYLELIAKAPLPRALDAESLAFDVGTGTGVIAAVLARRGLLRIQATDTDARALACARDNLQRLGVAKQVQVHETDLFPAGRAPLIVCNPPWLPGTPTSSIEAAIYDPDSRMLRGYLAGVTEHLSPGGEAWLVMSDLAEGLGLRAPEALSGWIEAASLRVLDRLETRPRHGKAQDAGDPLHAARSAEVTSLWRLAAV